MKCLQCLDSGIEEVYGGHGAVLELPCSCCQPLNIDDKSSEKITKIKEVDEDGDEDQRNVDVWKRLLS